MKIKLNHLSFLVVMALIFMGSLSLFFSDTSQISASAATHQHEYESYYHGNNDNRSDIFDGYSEQGCKEQILLSLGQQNDGGIQALNASTSNYLTCNSTSSSHGAGRQKGNATNFLTIGCGSWSASNCVYLHSAYNCSHNTDCGESYTYGATNIPYFLNITGMADARVADIRAQVDMWNQAVMHDGTGQIVNVYEVNHTNKINNLPVIIVKQANLSGNNVGEFNLSTTAPIISIDASMNTDTPVHEFGHLLGLDDLDWMAGVSNGTHKTLMGYNRGTTTATLSSAIKYQDIQGIAVVNNRHKIHRFNRYIDRGASFVTNRYVHFCFYCDIVDARSNIILGSAAMAMALDCLHTDNPMVSHNNRHWYKCTKCYRVNESTISPWNTTNTGTSDIRIDSVSYTIDGNLGIPSSINGRAITEIFSSAFFGQAGMKSVSLPNTLTTLGNSSFANCTGLFQITIPESVTSIGTNAFLNCSSLASITVDANNQQYSSRDGILYNKTKTQFVHIPQALAGTINIPVGIASIAASAFANRVNLTSVLFEKVSYTTSIGSLAFYNCTNLSTVTIPASITSVGENAFLGTNVYLITFDKQRGYGGHNFIALSIGSAMPSITMPKDGGPFFGGYFTEPSGCGTQYYDAFGVGTRPYNLAKNTVLYAHWLSNNLPDSSVIASGIIGSTGVGGVEWRLYSDSTASAEADICLAYYYQDGTWCLTIEFPFNFTGYILVSSSETVEIIYIGPNSLLIYSYDYMWVQLSIILIGCG